MHKISFEQEEVLYGTFYWSDRQKKIERLILARKS